MEARVLMMTHEQHPRPASGKPIINPTQDIVLGLYYATRERRFDKGCYRDNLGLKDNKLAGHLRGYYSSLEEVRMAYDHGYVGLHAGIKVRLVETDKDGNEATRTVQTTVGRVLISEVLPPGVPFEAVNKVLNKKALSQLIDALLPHQSATRTHRPPGGPLAQPGVRVRHACRLLGVHG